MATATRAGFVNGRFVRPGDPIGVEQKPLSAMTKAELIAEAERLGVAIESSATKAEILQALEAA
ncbi:hypothetical protein [Pararhizobium haloflavum]|uniref:hypothetical protein n=1 Tax=Pararhizobium haloflavum TaxID=2037914 RepID=UPI001300148F|nr:hypothetical protein [Pararhizobium haloflavum]